MTKGNGLLSVPLCPAVYLPFLVPKALFFAMACPHAHSISNLASSLISCLLTTPNGSISIFPRIVVQGSAWEFRVLGVCWGRLQRSQKAWPWAVQTFHCMRMYLVSGPKWVLYSASLWAMPLSLRSQDGAKMGHRITWVSIQQALFTISCKVWENDGWKWKIIGFQENDEAIEKVRTKCGSRWGGTWMQNNCFVHHCILINW